MDGRTHKHGISLKGGQKYLNIYMYVKYNKKKGQTGEYTDKRTVHMRAHGRTKRNHTNR